jgi:aryl-alcohol dehydrogenase-like predicted oxidoreductase
VATKGGLGGSGPDGRPEAIRRHCERSLTVLRREVIDLYQLHTVDPCVRIEESLGAIVDLQREGKVRPRRSSGPSRPPSPVRTKRGIDEVLAFFAALDSVG